MMKPSSWVIVSAVFFSGFAMAQSGSSVTESSDPAKIAAIEQHARQMTSGGAGMQPMDGQGMAHEQRMDHRMKHGMKHRTKHHMKPHMKHGMKHHQGGAAHKAAMHDKAAPERPMADEAKK